MNFPDVLTVKTIATGTGLAVPDVALILFLRASQKNDYHVGPMITDQSGQTKFTRAGCERAIARAQEMFIMDYAGDLSSCGPVAEIRVHSPEHIAAMIRQYETSPKFWGLGFDDPVILFSALKKVKNSDFESACVAIRDSDLLAHPEICIKLSRRQELIR